MRQTQRHPGPAGGAVKDGRAGRMPLASSPMLRSITWRSRSGGAKSPKPGPPGRRSKSANPPLPTIVVDRAARGGQQAADGGIRAIYDKAEAWDTYESASAAFVDVVKATAAAQDPAAARQLVASCTEMCRRARSRWGIRFCAWAMHLLGQVLPGPVFADVEAISGGAFAALYARARGADDFEALGVALGNTFAESVEHILDPAGAGAEYPRILHPWIAPHFPMLLHHGIGQRNASFALSAVVCAAEDVFLGTTRHSPALSGPCNGEVDDVVVPLFSSCAHLFLGFEQKVHPDAGPAFLGLLRSAADAALALAAFHRPLFTPDELLAAELPELLGAAGRVLGHPLFSVRMGVLRFLLCVFRDGRGARWPGGGGAAAVAALTEELGVVSKTDRVAGNRELAKEVLAQLDPGGAGPPPHHGGDRSRRPRNGEEKGGNDRKKNKTPHSREEDSSIPPPASNTRDGHSSPEREAKIPPRDPSTRRREADAWPKTRCCDECGSPATGGMSRRCGACRRDLSAAGAGVRCAACGAATSGAAFCASCGEPTTRKSGKRKDDSQPGQGTDGQGGAGVRCAACGAATSRAAFCASCGEPTTRKSGKRKDDSQAGSQGTDGQGGAGVRCAACGAATSGAAFCASCGEPTTRQSSGKSSDATSVRCGGCRAPVEGAARFCGVCGEKRGAREEKAGPEPTSARRHRPWRGDGVAPGQGGQLREVRLLLTKQQQEQQEQQQHQQAQQQQRQQAQQQQRQQEQQQQQQQEQQQHQQAQQQQRQQEQQQHKQQHQQEQQQQQQREPPRRCSGCAALVPEGCARCTHCGEVAAGASPNHPSDGEPGWQGGGSSAERFSPEQRCPSASPASSDPPSPPAAKLRSGGGVCRSCRKPRPPPFPAAFCGFCGAPAAAAGPGAPALIPTDEVRGLRASLADLKRREDRAGGEAAAVELFVESPPAGAARVQAELSHSPTPAGRRGAEPVRSAGGRQSVRGCTARVDAEITHGPSAPPSATRRATPHAGEAGGWSESARNARDACVARVSAEFTHSPSRWSADHDAASRAGEGQDADGRAGTVARRGTRETSPPHRLPTTQRRPVDGALQHSGPAASHGGGSPANPRSPADGALQRSGLPTSHGGGSPANPRSPADGPLQRSGLTTCHGGGSPANPRSDSGEPESPARASPCPTPPSALDRLVAYVADPLAAALSPPAPLLGQLDRGALKRIILTAARRAGWVSEAAAKRLLFQLLSVAFDLLAPADEAFTPREVRCLTEVFVSADCDPGISRMCLEKLNTLSVLSAP
ncbi:hypothetical protein DIPPA_06901 [Diplonema papillatum]|nr:hypothetical protein DIPPA_06901 [Diplonema papillatum]